MGRGRGLQLFLYHKRVREVERGKWAKASETQEARACAHWGHDRVGVLIVLPHETKEELLNLL